MKIVAIILSMLIFLGCVGCTTIVEKNPIEILNVSSVGFNEFDDNFISFVDAKKADENYMISPLSFKYALGLAVLGAGGETEKELYKAVGYEDFTEFDDLTKRMKILKSSFEEYNDSLADYIWISDAEREDLKIDFSVANSVWDVRGIIKDGYVEEVNGKLNAGAYKTSLNDVVEDVNSWVNENTKGLIPSILNDAPSELGAVLVNTVYLRSSWVQDFYVCSEPLKFKTVDGETVEKDAISKTGSFDYYKDADTELVVVGLNGGVKVAYVMGDTENIADKLSKATNDKEVYVEVPKMDIETSLDDKELVDYLIYRGVNQAFLSTADFSKMADDLLYISDIVQKTRIKTDEDGLEAAAATAITFKENSAVLDNPDPVEFIADEPFSFYIYSETEGVNDLMFYGKYVK